MQRLLLGLTEMDITPSQPMQTIGFGREDELSRGIMHNLYAAVSVWKLGSEKCSIVTIDHIGFSKEHADELREAIGQYLNVSKEKVMLCFSHTHSAPNESLENEYFNFVCSQVMEGAKKAVENMEPVKAGWGNAYGDIGVNRRGESSLDRRIGILKVISEESGKLKLIMLRLTAHANVLKADNYLISPDYFGNTRDLLSEKYGCSIMLTQGASGNIAPKYYKSQSKPIDANEFTVSSQSALDDMAEEIYKQVDKAMKGIRTQSAHNLKMYSVYEELHADVPSYERALEIADEARKYCGIDGSGWLAEVRRLIDNNVKDQIDNTEIQYFSLNDGCLCGAANEIMCEFALRAEEAAKSEFFYLGGYTNGCTGYFPTEEEYDKGGFEVYWSMLIYYIYHGRVSPLNRNCASQFIEAAVKNAPREEQ